GHRFGNGGSNPPVPAGHVVQGAVGLHVLQPLSAGAGKGGESSHLIQRHVVDVLRLHLHPPAAKSQKVRQTGMGSQSDSLLRGGLHGAPHHVVVSGVITAGDVGGRDKPEYLLIPAEGVGAKTLSQIRIQVHHPTAHASSPSVQSRISTEYVPRRTCSSISRYSSSPTGRKRSRSPIRSRIGSSRCGS